MIKHESTCISVIMPAFNAGNTVEAAIQSVLTQTHTNLELIVVDDGSQDDTCRLVSVIADERIRLIRHECNRGQGAARNTAIAAAKSTWFTLIDADDFWDNKRLEKLLEAAIRLGSGVMISDDIIEFYQVDAGIKPWRRVWYRQIAYRGNTTRVSLLEYLSFARTVMQPLIPRHAVIDNAISYPTTAVAEDLEFYIRLMKVAGLELHFIDFPGYYYRLTPGSMSTHPQRPLLARKVLEGLLGDLSFTTEEESVIHAKIKGLNRNIDYLPFLEALRNRQTGTLLKLAISRPWYLLEFIKRVPATLWYRLHVLLNRGASR